MSEWLFEGRTTVYVALAAAAFVLFVLWWQNRKRGWLIGAAVVVVLIGLYFLLDRLIETDREQITRRLQDISRGVADRSAPHVFANISDSFNLGGIDKKTFQAMTERVLRRGDVTGIALWDFDYPDGFRSSETLKGPGGKAHTAELARVAFRGKITGGIYRNTMVLCEARFVRDPDQQWRLLDFQVFNAFADQRTPIPIPQYMH